MSYHFVFPILFVAEKQTFLLFNFRFICFVQIFYPYEDKSRYHSTIRKSYYSFQLLLINDTETFLLSATKKRLVLQNCL